jgi:plastocyanin
VTDHAPDEVPAPAAGPSDRWRMVLLGLVLLTSAGVLALVIQSQLATELVQVEVAAGTAERLAAGEPIELLPATLEVAVGDRLEIVNNDHVTHQVGPYTVAPGQILRQSFTSPGTLEGACTLHPSGAIRIVVR